MSLRIYSDRRGQLWRVNSHIIQNSLPLAILFDQLRNQESHLKVAYVFCFSLSAEWFEVNISCTKKRNEPRKNRALTFQWFYSMILVVNRNPSNKCKGLLWSPHHWVVVLSPIYPQQPGKRFGTCWENRWPSKLPKCFKRLTGKKHDTFSSKLKLTEGTRWAPRNYKWSFNTYEWPYPWVCGVIRL